ncbi:hypothetical protein DPMN_007049 [Dreissena polymorpha]|uniref:Uncharacterized protein n=1 Tax=Dreissena polymorpha TaxID=45954 RepID=A0A9D4MWK5_DREPO|nr:hypothetical protein DPMN_108868 [Dreissena polymorpha]KAH3883099.1 hypothetical protein DPMN_007049 [Dreissena polymorpha]
MLVEQDFSAAAEKKCCSGRNFAVRAASRYCSSSKDAARAQELKTLKEILDFLKISNSNEVKLSASLNTVECPTTDIGQVVIPEDDDTQPPIHAVEVDEGTNCPVCNKRIDAINAAVPTKEG